jgi:hypothetical protein
MQKWLYPELGKFRDDADRAAAWETYTANWRRRIGFLAIIVGVNVLLSITPRAINLGPWAPSIMSFTLFVGIVTTWLISTRRRMRLHLRKELIKRGHRICIQCGYDLRGLPEPRCPECGTPFDFYKPPYVPL